MNVSNAALSSEDEKRIQWFNCVKNFAYSTYKLKNEKEKWKVLALKNERSILLLADKFKT